MTATLYFCQNSYKRNSDDDSCLGINPEISNFSNINNLIFQISNPDSVELNLIKENIYAKIWPGLPCSVYSVQSSSASEKGTSKISIMYIRPRRFKNAPKLQGVQT